MSRPRHFSYTESTYTMVLLILTCAACAISAVLVVTGMAASCELPYPSFFCYNEPFSDRAGCGGRHTSILGIRQTNSVMFVVWCIILFMHFPAGFTAFSLYSAIGFLVLHACLVVMVNAQLWIMRAERALHEELHANHLAQLEGAERGAGTHCPAAPLPPDIPMRSVELVVVLQPDFVGKEGDVRALQGQRQGVAYAWEDGEVHGRLEGQGSALVWPKEAGEEQEEEQEEEQGSHGQQKEGRPLEGDLRHRAVAGKGNVEHGQAGDEGAAGQGPGDGEGDVGQPGDQEGAGSREGDQAGPSVGFKEG